MFIYLNGKVQPFTGKVLFLGDSITDQGLYISYIQAYLMLHHPESRLQIYNLGLSSETVSGLTEPGHPYPRPRLQDRLDRALLTTEPNWVFVMYGINDGIYYPFSQERFSAYKQGMLETVRRIREYGCHVVVMTPTPFEADSCPERVQKEGQSRYGFDRPYQAYDQVMEAYSRFVLEEVSKEVDMVIDLRTPLLGQSVTGDGVHPGAHGHWLMARTILRHVMNVCLSEFDSYITDDFWKQIYERDQLMHCFYKEIVGHSLPEHAAIDTYQHTQMKHFGMHRKLTEYIQEHLPELTEKHSDWNGYERDDFYYQGYEAIVVKPRTPAAHHGWIWRTEFFGAFPSVDLAMLERGYYVVYLCVSNQYGAPRVLPTMEGFYYLLREKYPVSERMIPFGFSRGGLYAMLLANAHPAWIAALYLDAPCVDIRSWPREQFAMEWEECKAAWDYTEATVDDYEAVMKERIETLVLSQMPLALVYGDADSVVPYDRNGALLEKAYREAGAPCCIIRKPGCDHHPHSLEDPRPVAEFLEQYGQ